MVVLLNVPLTTAIPSASITRFAFLPIAMFTWLPALLGHLLLADDCAAWSLLGTGIGVRTLTTNWKSTAMTNAAVAPDVHQALDVHRDLGAERALNANILLDRLTQTVGVRIVQIANSLLGVDSGRFQNPTRCCAADTEDVGEADLDLLLAREIHASDTRHYQPCFCLCFGLRLQMMRVTPCLLMTLQCSQIGFTLLRTFTSNSYSIGKEGVSPPKNSEVSL